MTGPAAVEGTPPAYPLTRARAKPNGYWGMWGLIATEATLFAVFIATYFYLRFHSVTWPPPGIPEPKVVRPLVNNGILVLTVVPTTLAFVAARRDRQALLRLGLLAAFLLGTAYFFLQLDSFMDNWKVSKPEDGAYSSIVYTLVGAHWIHVGAGLFLLLWIQLRAWMGAFGPERNAPVLVTAMYWYFLDVLALAVVGTTLSPAV